MKASHFTTPRTLQTCEFHESGQALHGFTGGPVKPWLSVESAAVLAVVLAVVGYVVGRLL